MAKRKIGKKLVRTAENPVTHELETTVLDAVQVAYERVHQAVDAQMLKLSVAEQHRLATRLLDLAAGMLPHTDVKE